MSSMQLNLARKWRSRTFDQLIGQELVVRMLKNSLYLDHYFPVYLFSGQHGCGKTTMARIFAGAVNCQKLVDFQRNPKQQHLPCLQCDSCTAMAAGNHPDFIEIDAASHTGVDNVRNIIDAAALLPVLGRKKIYLIDEAHMLSKAAFNAFLKILEEPPQSVLFILATTDIQKILETVRSRSFQLFFNAVPESVLLKHLQRVCTDENIAADAAGLQTIIQQTGGSVRDALNLLEQVRFAGESINKSAVLQVLGYLDEESVLQIIDAVIKHDPAKVLQLLRTKKIESYNISYVWQHIIAVIRALIWLHYDLEPIGFAEQMNFLKELRTQVSIAQLCEILQILYEHEATLLKTTMQYQCLEMILLQVCVKDYNQKISPISVPAPEKQKLSSSQKEESKIAQEAERIPRLSSTVQTPQNDLWKTFLQALEQLNDPLISSIFKHASDITYVQETKTVQATFSQQFVFFKEWLDNSVSIWKPMLDRTYGQTVEFCPSFTGTQEVKESVVPAPQVTSASTVQKAVKSETLPSYKNGKAPFNAKNKPSQKEPVLDVSDTEKWKKTHMILKFFSGTITEMKEGSDE